jgi:orotidine-5'-phosphate decarboxylase
VNASRAIIYASNGKDFADEAREIARQYQFEMLSYLLPRIGRIGREPI